MQNEGYKHYDRFQVNSAFATDELPDPSPNLINSDLDPQGPSDPPSFLFLKTV